MENKFGLLKLPKDNRDFSLGAVYTLPKVSELPLEFELEPIWIGDQGNSDFCTAFATCGASSLQEGVQLVPEFSFALSKELTGGLFEFGQNLRDACRVHVKIGAIEEKDRPAGFSIADKTSDFLRDIKNWPDVEDLKIKALVHAKNSYMAVSVPGLDWFDAIRATIFYFREEKRGVPFGLEWSWPINQSILEEFGSGGGHAIYATGWRVKNGEPHIVIVNSYGKKAGENGKFYLSRKIINKFVEDYGCFMLDDMTPAEYQTRLKSLSQNWINRAFSKVLEALRVILVNMQKTPVIAPQPQQIDPITPIRPPEPVITPFSPIIVKWAKAIECEEGFW